MSQYCHSCGEPLADSAFGWVTAVKVDAPGGLEASFGEPPVKLHTECRNRLHTFGIRYQVLDVRQGDGGPDAP